MRTFKLYGTLGCHLCDVAEEVINDVLEANPDALNFIALAKVDISDSDELMTAYAERIPVLACAETQAELAWPFDHQAFVNFLNQNLR
ncbi:MULTISPECIES: glutaredoxin family protein [unclassified Hahella]|uniref:glutaredoxin family protein n=1 Tax=unclassified Hahella TaxID=2624107 RepID=UPI001C1EA4C6|nr:MULTISPECIES: glutaredoxin family protein [unclassified Hahella]MBU6953001.1 glutaredoxin family protein [Hahella sp. HN01]MDG9668677.1 glutaredoxin family protein [Hahella sp. CR1]